MASPPRRPQQFTPVHPLDQSDTQDSAATRAWLPDALARLAARRRERIGVLEGAPLGDLAPDVLLVSHVLGELDARGLAELRRLIERSARARTSGSVALARATANCIAVAERS